MTFKYKEHKDSLFFIPLGGTTEIGLNCSLYQYMGKWIMVDLGLGFADQDKVPGVDIVVPDLNTIESFKKDLLGVVLTHAHEDHIGAIQYVWDEFDCKIYANKFTSAVLQAKLAESNIKHDDRIIEFKDGETFELGPFKIEAIGLSHSVPEMSSLFIQTEEGNIFHSGDWKMDSNPVVGTVTRPELLKKIGQKGVDVLISDSTNIFTEGYSKSEGDLKDSLTKIISGIKEGIVVVTTFASNIARIKSISMAAKASNRRVALLGRSLHRMSRAARDTGYLEDVEAFVNEDSLKKYKREELVVIATGCQGEENAAISKLSNKDHRFLNLNNKDTVIFASKIIPGNEKRIFSCMNNFASLDIKVITEHDHFVHVSGHPSREEVKELYKLLKPKFSIPVHGEIMHIHEHARFAREIGVSATAIAENGIAIRITKDEVYSIGRIPVSYLAVDGNYLTPTDSRIFKERKIMNGHGIVIVSVKLDSGRKLKGRPYIIGPGALDSKEDANFIEQMQDEIAKILVDRNNNSTAKLKSSIYGYVTKAIRNEVGKRPLVEVIIEN